MYKAYKEKKTPKKSNWVKNEKKRKERKEKNR